MRSAPSRAASQPGSRRRRRLRSLPRRSQAPTPTPTPTAPVTDDATGDAADGATRAVAGAAGGVRAGDPHRRRGVRAPGVIDAQQARAGSCRWSGGVRRSMTHIAREEASMRRTAISRVGRPRCGARRGPMGADERRGGGGRVPGGELPGRPAELQHAGLQRFRDARDEDQAGLQSRGSRAARADHRQRRGARTGRARGAGAGHDQRPGGHPLHQLPLGGNGPSARLPLRASALRRRARRPADRAQERAREPTLPAPTAGPGRRLPITHLQHQRRHARRAARHLRGRRTDASRARRAAPTTSVPTRPRSGSPTPSLPPSESSATAHWRAASGCSGTQPLNYDASDNVGVRAAQAVVSGQTGGTQQRQCALASPDGAFANGVPCQNGPGSYRRGRRTTLPRGNAARSSCRPRTPPATPGPRPR